MSDKKPKSLFVKTLEDIKNTKKLGYATIARLIGIKTTKIYNILHQKSTAQKQDIQALLTKFPEYKHLFSHIEHLNLPAPETKYVPQNQDLVSILNDKIALYNDKIALYEETKTAQRETIESLKEEIIRLKEIVALQRKIIEENKKAQLKE